VRRARRRGIATQSTCWTVIEGAAAGREEDRERFARQYEGAVRAYLGARWRGSPLLQELDDAAQEVFVECFRGALERPRRDGSAGFRPFLFGVVRNVARRFEDQRARRPVRTPLPESSIPARDRTLSEVFDQAWAEALLDRARALHVTAAKESGAATERRVELLHLRHVDDLPIREIARRWDVDPAWLHHQYAQAREEFKRALFQAVAFEHPGTAGEIRRECAHLVSFFR
jgi:RNA polymerase sigma-70 factor (ECF subfamily)